MLTEWRRSNPLHLLKEQQLANQLYAFTDLEIQEIKEEIEREILGQRTIKNLPIAKTKNNSLVTNTSGNPEEDELNLSVLLEPETEKERLNKHLIEEFKRNIFVYELTDLEKSPSLPK